MSSKVDSKKDQEQDEDNKTVDVVSPYFNEISSFENPETNPDLEFFVAGMEKPLKLHMRILAKTSGYLKAMLNERRDQRLEWPHDISNEIDRKALVKALRFCYGETQSVSTKNGECIAMIAVLTRLQVTRLDDVVTLLTNFAVEEAKRELETGVELLKTCIEYKECCGSSQNSLDKKLATIVLTKENICDHYKEVVDECLMVLPPDYLTVAEYGEPHTRCSEFCLRTKYARLHSKTSSKEEKQKLIGNCDWSTLNSQELCELRLADIIDKDELLEAHEKALEHCEIENEMARRAEKKMEEKVKELEKKNEKESERVKKAESEAEEQRGRAERAEKGEKEKEDKVKHLEMERDKCAKEAEEYKKRAEEAEKENVKYLSQVETLNTLLQRNGLHTCSPQSE